MLHRATCFVNVARLFPKLAENENRTNTSNLRQVYWANARMRMYGHDEIFIAERNTNLMLQALAETVKHHLANDNAQCNVFYDRRCTNYSHNFTPVLGV